MRKAIGAKLRRQRRGQIAHRRDGSRIRIDGVDVEAAAQKVDQIAAASAPGVENAGGGRDTAAQQLIEQVDVDVAEVIAEVHY